MLLPNTDRDDTVIQGGQIDVSGPVMVCTSVRDQERFMETRNDVEHEDVQWQLFHDHRCWFVRSFRPILLEQQVSVQSVAFCAVKVLVAPEDGSKKEVPAYLFRPIESQRMNEECSARGA